MSIRYLDTSKRPKELRVSAYPDGTPLVSAPDFAVQRLLVQPASVSELMAALWFVDALHARGFKSPELILPCVPGQRQDRINREGDYLFTLKSVAAEINLRQFPRVVVLDPHSDVVPALIERCEVISAASLIFSELPLLDDYAAVISPDAGAEKRAAAVAKMLALPLLHGWKTRDVRDGRITGFGLEPPALRVPAYNHTRGDSPLTPCPKCISQRHRVLVVDDICDAGGTFAGLSTCIDLSGLVPNLWVTHGYFSHGAVARLKTAGYQRVLTTDSVLGDRDGVAEFSVCERLLIEGQL